MIRSLWVGVPEAARGLKAALLGRLLFVALMVCAAPGAFAQFTLDPITLPDAILGVPYPSVLLTTTGGIGPVSWQFTGTVVPPTGFVVGPSGNGSTNTTGSFCWGSTLTSFVPVCSGTVQGFLPGVFQFTIRARDGGLQFSERQVTLRVLQTLLISTTSLPDVPINSTYSQQLQVTGGSGSYQWSIVSGALPQGLTINAATGIISGIAPSIGGNFTVTIGVKDLSTQATTTQQFTLHVISGLQISSADPPFFTVGQAIAPYQFAATGGTTYQWAVAPGSNLPPNFALSTDGILSGAGTTVGTFLVTLRVTDPTQSASAQKAFTLTVTNGDLRIIETLLPKAAVNTSYQTTLTGAGGIPPYSWSFSTLDTRGFSMVSSTGTIFGTPTAFGQITLPVTLVDSIGSRATQTYTLTILPQLILNTTTIPNAAVGTPYSLPLAASGGETPYTWTLTSGTLPSGLTLNANSGTIEGTPLNASSTNFTLRVTDNGGRIDSRAFTMVVGPGVLITTTSLGDAIAGQGYTFGMQSTGGALPLQWTVVSGSLPSALVIDAVTGVITGVPASAGAFTFTMRVRDAASNTNEKAFTLNVVAQLVITAGPIPFGQRTVAYSYPLATSGGRAPYTWTLASGSLSPGLSLNSSTGVISGTPTQSGTFNFNVTVADAGGQSVNTPLIQTIVDPLTITSGDLSGIAGQPFSQTLTIQGGPGVPAPVWSIASGTLPFGLKLNTSTGEISGTTSIAGVTPITVGVSQVPLLLTKDITITITFPALPAMTFTLPAVLQPAQQPTFDITLASGFPGSISGTLDLSFVSAVGGDDTSVAFGNGGRSETIGFSPGSTSIDRPLDSALLLAMRKIVRTGTVAGTITLSLHDVVASNGSYSVSQPGASQSKSFTIARSTPVITSVVLQRLTNSVNVVVTGYSTTREVSSGAFHFTATSGNSVAQSDVT
ncbi:MAG: Ig domain-containing protein, partial [Acidobacteriota bacterium]